ncbi:hypothetical protein [Alkalicoccus chagannorensis]|uniref:hypothetical protein n=1 Tax=Alkalicoccus chagannorensis TaxID=427072 RepID=UPI0004188B0D|nr:hypothetical protein [Alkalicoccus chagannorensis]
MEKDRGWQITEADIRRVIEEKFPELSDEERNQIIQLAQEGLEVPHWKDMVKAYDEIQKSKK